MKRSRPAAVELAIILLFVLCLSAVVIDDMVYFIMLVRIESLTKAWADTLLEAVRRKYNLARTPERCSQQSQHDRRLCISDNSG